jgi:hypothetical protein
MSATATWNRAIAIDKNECNYRAYIRDMSDGRSRPPRMVSRVVDLLAAAVLVCVFAMPAAGQGPERPVDVVVYTATPKRIMASGAALTGLIGAVIGGLAWARSAGRIGFGNGRRMAIVALVLGPIGLVLGGLVVVSAEGGVGTGNGIAGGVVAMVVGLIGVALGRLALARSHRTA